MVKLIHVDVAVILICLCLKFGNANYLNTRRTADSSHAVKGDEDSSNVRAVGEVFVPKTFPLSSQEPTCEQLRAMWIFSKRQSRAAEITNEIPTYRDPFAYNVWEPLYSNSRLLGSIRMGARERARSPVFGRVVSREPILPQRMPFEQRQRFGDPVGPARFYGAESRPQNSGSSSRRSSKNRYMGVPATNVPAANAAAGGSQNAVAVQGSFQKLKELIWTERAKELTQQRRDEEMAARAAVLKEIANGQNIQPSYKPQLNSQTDYVLMDENRSPDGSSHQYVDIDRIPIASEQTRNSHRHTFNGGRASTRRIGNSGGGGGGAGRQTYKESIFSGNSGRSARIKIPATDVYSEDLPENGDRAVIGIPRTYPIRQSHFRERNRSLFKQFSPNEQFQRDAREPTTWQMELPKASMDSTANQMSLSPIVGYDAKPSGGFLQNGGHAWAWGDNEQLTEPYRFELDDFTGY